MALVPRLAIRIRRFVLIGPFLTLGTTTSADVVDFPLHLEPVRLRPFYDYVEGAAVTAVTGGFYAIYSPEDMPYGLPLQPTGAAAYPNPLPLRAYNFGSYHEGAVGAAAMSGDALVVWDENISGTAHVIAAWQAHAEWTHPSRPSIDLGPGSIPAVAGAGGAALVVWKASGGIDAVRLEAAAWPSFGSSIPIAPGYQPDEIAIAFAPGLTPEVDVYLVVWRQTNVIYSRILTATGVPLTNIRTMASVQANSLSVSWDKSNFVLVWSTISSVDAIRVSTSGLAVDPQPIHLAGPSPPASFAKGGSHSAETLVAWIEGDYEPTYRVRGARIDQTGQVLDPGGFLIREGQWMGFYIPNRVAGVAYGGDRYLVEWIENYLSCGGLIVALQDVLAATVVPDSPPVVAPVQLISGSADQNGLSAAWVGETIWTAWLGGNRSGSEILAARRDRDGALMDQEGILLDEEASCAANGYNSNLSGAAVAGGTDKVLTCWRYYESSNYMTFAYGKYMLHNAAGQLVGSGGFGFDSFCTPVAMSDGQQFFIASLTMENDYPNEPVTRWTGVSGSGAAVSGGYLDLGAEEQPLDAASNGNGFLLAWSILGDGNDAYVGRFDADFTFLDPAGIALATGPGDQSLVRVASNRNDYLAIWTESGTLRAARIDAGGVVVDPGGFVIVDRPVAPFDLDWDGRHYIVAWAEQEGPQDVVRIRRIGSDGSSPDPEPLEVLRRSDEILTCSVASRSDGLSLIALTTRRPTLPWSESSGHGILYQNPSPTAVAGSAPAMDARVRALPNPFRAEAFLLLGDRAGRPGALRILDAGGRVVRRFEAPDGLVPRIRWDGMDGRGQKLSPGVYFYEVVAAGAAPATGKLTKLR